MKKDLGSILRAASDSVKKSTEQEKILFIKASELNIHPKNELFYKKITSENVQDLKQSIVEMGGVMEPLIVTQHEDNKLYIIAGNRRRAAVIELFREGKLQNEQVPYKIRKFDNEEDEMRSIVLLNSQRKKTILEERAEIVYLADFYKKEKEAKKIKGETRKYVADRIGISETLLQRYQNLNKLSKTIEIALDNVDIAFNMATEFTSLNQKEQDEIYNELIAADNLTIKNVRNIKKAFKAGYTIEDLDKNNGYSIKKTTIEASEIPSNDDEDIEAENGQEKVVIDSPNDDNTDEDDDITFEDDTISDEPEIDEENERNNETKKKTGASKNDVILEKSDETKPDKKKVINTVKSTQDGENDIDDANEYWRNLISIRIEALSQQKDEEENEDIENKLKECIECGKDILEILNK